jgi:hypothetical protein
VSGLTLRGVGATQIARAFSGLEEPNMLKIRAPALAGPLLCVELATGPPASALEQHLEITNTSRLAIVELYAARPDTGAWEKDVLGEDYLQPGNSVVVKIDEGSGYCRFDLKIVFDNGAELIRRNVDVCDSGNYSISYR